MHADATPLWLWGNRLWGNGTWGIRIWGNVLWGNGLWGNDLDPLISCIYIIVTNGLSNYLIKCKN